MTNIILRANDQHAHQKIDPERTAIIIIDVWDDHWCKHYKKLNDLLAERLAPAIDRFRAAGVKIIHSPCGQDIPPEPRREIILSDYSCIPFYYDTQARHNAISVRNYTPSTAEPISVSKRCRKPNDIFFKGVWHNRGHSGKCCTCSPSCDRPFPRPWSRQHPLINVCEEDYVTDDLDEVGHVLLQDNIENLFYVGGALNACLIDRPHGMLAEFNNVFSAFIRDFTISHLPRDEILNIDPNDEDSQPWPGWEIREKYKLLCETFNINAPVKKSGPCDASSSHWFPDKAYPQLSYDLAHEIQSRYIEQKVCPSILSEELLHAFSA